MDACGSERRPSLLGPARREAFRCAGAPSAGVFFRLGGAKKLEGVGHQRIEPHSTRGGRVILRLALCCGNVRFSTTLQRSIHMKIHDIRLRQKAKQKAWRSQFVHIPCIGMEGEQISVIEDRLCRTALVTHFKNQGMGRPAIISASDDLLAPEIPMAPGSRRQKRAQVSGQCLLRDQARRASSPLPKVRFGSRASKRRIRATTTSTTRLRRFILTTSRESSS